MHTTFGGWVLPCSDIVFPEKKSQLSEFDCVKGERRGALSRWTVSHARWTQKSIFEEQAKKKKKSKVFQNLGEALSACLPAAQDHLHAWTAADMHAYFPYPTTNGGMQTGSSVGISTRCIHVLAPLGADLHAQSVIFNKKNLQRSSVGSLSGVHCRLGRTQNDPSYLLPGMLMMVPAILEEREKSEVQMLLPPSFVCS